MKSSGDWDRGKRKVSRPLKRCMDEEVEGGGSGPILSGIVQKGVIRIFHFNNFAEPNFPGFRESFAQIEPEP